MQQLITQGEEHLVASNRLRSMLGAYLKANKITIEQVAEKLGKKKTTVFYNIQKGTLSTGDMITVVDMLKEVITVKLKSQYKE